MRSQALSPNLSTLNCLPPQSVYILLSFSYHNVSMPFHNYRQHHHQLPPLPAYYRCASQQLIEPPRSCISVGGMGKDKAFHLLGFVSSEGLVDSVS